MNTGNWIYFEGSEVLVRLDDFNAIKFTAEDGTPIMILRDGKGHEVVIYDMDDINNFRKNILKIGEWK